MLNFGLNKFCHFNENLEFFSPSVQLLHHIHGEHFFTGISWKVAGIWDIPSRCFVVYNRGDGYYRRTTTEWCWRKKAAGGFFSFLSFQVQRQQLLSRAAIIEPLLVVGSIGNVLSHTYRRRRHNSTSMTIAVCRSWIEDDLLSLFLCGKIMTSGRSQDVFSSTFPVNWNGMALMKRRGIALCCACFLGVTDTQTRFCAQKYSM